MEQVEERKHGENDRTIAVLQTSAKSLPNLLEIQIAIRQGKSPAARRLMRIPERFAGKCLLNTTEAKRATDAFETSQSLFLHGIPGSGKTHTALALMQGWFATRIKINDNQGGIIPLALPPIFLPAVELLHEIKASWDEHEARRTDNEKTIFDHYSSRPLLVLDDLGAEKISDWSRQVIYLLLDRRYRDCKQTIITSNLNLQELADALDPRIASRLCEMGVVIDMGKKDWRVK